MYIVTRLILWAGLLLCLTDGFIVLYLSNRQGLKRTNKKLYDRLQNISIILAMIGFTCLYIFCCIG